MLARGLILLGSSPAVLMGCASGSSGGDDSYHFELPQSAVRAQVLALAECPSPLQRLKIAAEPRSVTQPDRDTIVLAVTANDAPQPIELRFKFDEAKDDAAQSTRLRFHLTIPDAAQELELGPGQLIAPGLLSEQLGIALKSYFELQTGYQTARPIDNSRRIASKCAQIGRLLDDGAVLISPALAQNLKRQRRRDALNWLFKDDYQLQTQAQTGQSSD